jgi:hypothetical protein
MYDAELIRAQVRDGLGGGEQADEAAGALAQDGVPGGVPEALVDRHETIELDVHERELGLGPAVELA